MKTATVIRRNVMRKVVSLCVAAGLAIVLAGPAAHAQLIGSFNLKVSPAAPSILPCLRRAPTVTPAALVIVGQGTLADDLTIVASGIKPGLAFDLFTVQNSNATATGALDPNFKNFGLAWYQTDLEANSSGQILATLHTILINQIFGFDPAVALPPTNTFHVGFWFNDPNAAVPCGFNAAKPTPFNGEHMAGPLAMISVPNATTKLGPLCLSPVFSGGVWKCHP
jgi:hypothetical protein